MKQNQSAPAIGIAVVVVSIIGGVACVLGAWAYALRLVGAI